jgi:hypothetical protein
VITVQGRKERESERSLDAIGKKRAAGAVKLREEKNGAGGRHQGSGERDEWMVSAAQQDGRGLSEAPGRARGTSR